MHEFVASLGGNVLTVPFSDVFNKVRVLFGKDESDDEEEEDCCSNPRNLDPVSEEQSFWGTVTIYKCRKCGSYVR